MLPTRLSTFEQTMMCGNNPCPERYNYTKRLHQYVADPEKFTLLVDHTFSVEEIGLRSDSRNTVGFVKLCRDTSVDSQIHHVLSHLGPAAFGETEPLECARILIPGTGHNLDGTRRAQLEKLWSHDELDPKLKAIWDAEPAVFSIPDGDVINVGQVLKLLDVDLDAIADHKHNYSYRHEGFAMKIDINYYNWKEYSWPNKFPPIYEIHFLPVPHSDYKLMAAVGDRVMIPGTTLATREVVDIHGIYFSASQRGSIGTWCMRNIVWMFIEASVFLTLGQFIVLCCCLNFLSTEQADFLEHHCVKECKFKDDGVAKFEICCSPDNRDSHESDEEQGQSESDPLSYARMRVTSQ